MHAIAEPRMLAARIQGRARLSQGCAERARRIWASSHGPAAGRLIRQGVLHGATGRAMNAPAALDAHRGIVNPRRALPRAPLSAQLSAGPLLTVARTARPS